MRGQLYVVGVGPGDPEDLTLKAARLLRGCGAAAFPGDRPEETLAFRIAAQAVPALREKRLIALPTPMTREASALAEAHRVAAARLLTALEEEKTVVCPVLGDPMVYGSFTQVLPLLEAEGVRPLFVPGVTSFCAAAAALGRPLCEGNETLCLIPGGVYAGAAPGERCVLMKTGAAMGELKARLREEQRSAAAVLNCGMKNQKLCRSLDEIPEDAGYFTVVLI